MKRNFKVVAIIHKSNGNETVGDMWKETKIFDLDTPIEKIVLWANIYIYPLNKHLEITVTEIDEEQTNE